MKLVEMLSAVEVKGLEVVKDKAQKAIKANPFLDIEATFLAMDAINNAIEVKEETNEIVKETVEMVKEVVKVERVNNIKSVKKEKVKVMRNEERIVKFFEMVEKMAKRSIVIQAAQGEAKKLFNAVPFEFFIKSIEQLATSKQEYKIMEGFVMKNITRSSVKQMKEHGIINIGKSKQLVKAINTVMHKGDMPFFNKVNVITDLDINGQGQSTVNAVPATNSGFAVELDYYNKPAQLDLDGYKVKVGDDSGNYATTDVIYVSCKSCKEEMIPTIEQIKKHGLYKSGKDVFFPSYIDGKLELRQGSTRGKAYKYVLEDEKGIFIGKEENGQIKYKIATHYTFFNASPSQERVGDFMCIDETKYGLNASFAGRANKFALLDKILGNALSYALAQVDKNGEMDTAKALKIGTRVALHNTASVELGKVGNEEYGVLYIKNTISGANDYTKDMLDALNELGVKIDEAIVDGQGWILADMIVDYIEKAGVKVNYNAVKGTGFQMRTQGINDKVFNLAISKKERDMLVKRLIAANPYKLDKNGQPTKEVGYVIVGNPNNIAYIIDANGAKLPNMWRFDEVEALAHGMEYGNFTMNILAVADDSNANTSIQAIGKVVNEEIKEALANAIYNTLVDSLDRIIKGSISMNTKSAKAQKLFAANKERSTISHVAHKMILEELSDQAMTAIRKLKIAVDGLNLRAFFDNTFLYTGDEQSVFKVREGGVVEAYSKSAIKKYRKELKAIQQDYLAEIAKIDDLVDAQEMTAQDAIIAKASAKAERTNLVDAYLNAFTVKYPCPTDIEFAKFRYLADFEVEEAIQALNANNKTKQVLKDMILGLNDGIVMIAPLNTLKHKLAGMDTDFDGITSFFEKSIVDSAFSKESNDVVYIDKLGEKSIYNKKTVKTVKTVEKVEAVEEIEFA